MKKCLIACVVALVCSTTLASDSKLITHWSYPYNNSTYRVYTAHNAQIVYVLETGANGFNEFDGLEAPQTSVTLFGDADEADIHIIPLHPSCWSIDINTDYLLLNRTKRSVLPCYEYRFPILVQTSVITA